MKDELSNIDIDNGHWEWAIKDVCVRRVMYGTKGVPLNLESLHFRLENERTGGGFVTEEWREKAMAVTRMGIAMFGEQS